MALDINGYNTRVSMGSDPMDTHAKKLKAENKVYSDNEWQNPKEKDDGQS